MSAPAKQAGKPSISANVSPTAQFVVPVAESAPKTGNEPATDAARPRLNAIAKHQREFSLVDLLTTLSPAGKSSSIRYQDAVSLPTGKTAHSAESTFTLESPMSMVDGVQSPLTPLAGLNDGIRSYRIEGKLGTGSFSEVFRAVHLATGEPVSCS